jgi:hypothetical protein
LNTASVDIDADCTLNTYSGFDDWTAIDLQQVSGRPNYPSSHPGSLDIPFEVANQQAPPAPVALAARVSSGTVHLAWNPVILGITNEYRVYRYQNSNPQGTLAFIGHTLGTGGSPPPATLTDSTPIHGVAYTYFATAKDEFGNESDISNLLSVTP